ncbi:hypothetical protein J4206_02525 [Candidatus Woesearchaeota archaeon]|nr:hypothetical protein [Candidatus Woesearchaeota archaeon]
MANQTPVFVKIDEYKEVLQVMELIKSKLEQAKTTLNKVNQIKTQEDNELAAWQQALAEVEKKVEFIDQKLLQPSN